MATTANGSSPTKRRRTRTQVEAVRGAMLQAVPSGQCEVTENPAADSTRGVLVLTQARSARALNAAWRIPLRRPAFDVYGRRVKTPADAALERNQLNEHTAPPSVSGFASVRLVAARAPYLL